MFADGKLRPLRYAMAAVLVAALPALAPNPFFLNLAQEVVLLAIAGIGLNFLLGLSGQISLGQAGFFGIAAYASGLLAQRWGMPLVLAIPLAVVVSGLAGLAVGLVALRARAHYLAMVTLAFGFIVGIVAQRWITVTGGSMGLVGLPQLNWGDPGNAARNFLWTVAGILLLLQIVGDFLMQSRAGRVMRTIAESESFALTVGIRASAWRAGTFIVSAMLAGLAGALFSHQLGYVSSDAVTLDRSLAILIVVVVGGLGHAYGPLLGAIFLVAMNQAMAGVYTYSNYIFGALLLIVMVFLPHGLSGLLRVGRQVASGGLPDAQTVRPVLDLPSKHQKNAQPVLELQGVTKSYAGVKAVQDVSMTVHAGTVHALIGPNGAGKSTLINVISGLYRPDSGSIRLSGEDVTAWPAYLRARKGLARTFQNLQLIGGLTVIENVMLGLPAGGAAWRRFGLWLIGRPHESMERTHAQQLLDMLGIGAYANASPAELSYGHRKLAELARALAQQPTLMLLDEPIAGINEEESRQIAEGIARLRDAGVTILLVEHDMPFVMSLADEITVLDHGQRIASGAPAEVRGNPAVIDAYLGVEAGK
ncbi:MAG: branched-chain amino acid ABC transporter ATP-binding protein/permease [Burkholderiaceae bacterium]